MQQFSKIICIRIENLPKFRYLHISMKDFITVLDDILYLIYGIFYQKRATLPILSSR